MSASSAGGEMAVKRHRLAARRRALGFTQEALAERLGVDASTVRRWESGEIASGPHPWIRPKLAQYLQVSGEELDELLTEGDSLRANGAVGPAEHKDSIGVGPTPGMLQVERLRRGLHEALAGGAPREASLEDWELTVARYGAATRDRAAPLLLSDLSVDFGELQNTLDRCRSVSGLRRLTRVAAHMSGLMCLTLIKLDERKAFRGWARTARVAAAEADDPVTYSWVLAQEAYGHFYSDDFPEAVNVARHAKAVVPKRPGVGAVLAAALEARALAALGRAEASATLREAEAIFAALDNDAVTASAFGYNEAQLRFHEGNALTHLGDTKAALSAQDRALALLPAGDFMDRALTELDRAVCLARDGDASAAASGALDTLLRLSEQQRQGIISRRAEQLVAALPRQGQAPAPARELRDLLIIPARTEG
ncbi:MAG TPA: helix-turn-helix transcriptional regulator [Actinomycetota bacterium]|nr:helix-turn-helix transcriptional regulator [Actinomycetota bacterium]